MVAPAQLCVGSSATKGLVGKPAANRVVIRRNIWRLRYITRPDARC